MPADHDSQSVIGMSPTQSVYNLLPYIGAATFSAGLTGISVPKVRYYNPFFLVGAVCFPLGGYFLVDLDEETPALARSGYLVLLGLGVGFMMLANVAPCRTVLDEKDHSVANGLAFFCSSLGPAIAIPVSSTLFNTFLINEVPGLDVPPIIKLALLVDPTALHTVVPAEYLPAVIDLTTKAIRRVFILGLGGAAASSVSFLFIPWTPIVRDKGSKVQEGRTREDAEQGGMRVSRESEVSSVTF